MFKSLVLLASLVGAAAFAPQTSRVSASALKMDFKGEVGVQPPLGFWDPLGLLKNADQQRFDNLRRYEVKHGDSMFGALFSLPSCFRSCSRCLLVLLLVSFFPLLLLLLLLLLHLIIY